MAERFGRFWLHERIGQGGMAEVFRATIGPDPHTYGFDLALKRILPNLARDQTQVDMFLTEADVGKLLRHPNIVEVYESGIVNGQAYIAMEYVWGMELATLQEHLRRRRLRMPTDVALYIVQQVLRALDYVHNATTPAGQAMEIVHRDVTPSNIFVTYAGEVKLGDFGVARVKFLEGHEDAGIIKGKVTYVPPEVLAGHEVEQSADLWSLAITLYEMLTARRAFEHVPEEDLLSGSFVPRLLPVHKENPDVPQTLSRLLHKALAPNPKKRFADAVMFYRELKQQLRKEGIEVGAPALARFTTAVTGGRPLLPEPKTNKSHSGVFEPQRLQAPVAMSPTQRFEQRRKHRQSSRAYWVIGGVLVVGLLVVVALRSARSPTTPASGPAPAPVAEDTSVAPTGAPAANGEARARPEEEAVTIDFSDEVAIAPDLGPPSARFKALLHRGAVQAKRKKFVSAEEAFREALDIRPGDIAATLGRANVLIELQRAAEAEQLVRSALVMSPDNPRIYLLLGDVLWVQGNDNEAKAAYKKCADLDPSGTSGKTAKRILQGL